jgi:manganese-dependent ADP-ribose/CDP-alcohol diphosphatase
LLTRSSSQTSDREPILKIGLIADPQYCNCDATPDNRFYREILNRLPAAIDTMNKTKVDFVMNLGDMIDKDEDSYAAILPFFKRLTMPYYNLLGNHDLYSVSDEYLSTILDRYEMPDFYYDLSYGPWRFIVLDGTELGEYSRFLHPELAEESDSLWRLVQGNVNAHPWNGGIGRKQQLWLRSRLQEALDQQQNVIVFCHFPVYPYELPNTLFNSSQIVDLLEDFPNMIAFIAGHQHEGAYGNKNGIHYITQKAMVDTMDINSFAILEIYPDLLRIKGFGNISDTELPYYNSINKTKY